MLDRIPFFRSSRTHRELQKQFEEFDAAEVRVAKAPHGSNGHAGTPAPQPPEHQHI